MSEFQITKATRTGVKALIGMYGLSSSGKTMSALLIMRGLVGPKGRIVLCDSESGRGSIFADIIPGGYDVINLEPPFSPERYQEAFEYAEANSDGVIYDSLSHEHAGDGGVLDMQEAELERMAGNDYKKREQCKMAAWVKPKAAHNKFIQRLLRSKVPLICCLRGQEKTHMVKEQNKQKVVTDEFSSPIFDQRFIFELLLNFETVAKNGEGGFVIPRKITHPSIKEILPRENEQIGVAFGERLARWCANTGAPAPVAKPTTVTPAPMSTQATEKTRQWMLGELVKSLSHEQIFQYAIDKGYIMPDASLDTWNLDFVPTKKSGLEELRASIEKHQ